MSRFIAFLFVVTLFVGCAPAEQPATPPAEEAATAPAEESTPAEMPAEEEKPSE